MRSRILIGAEEIARYLSGYQENRKHVGVKKVRWLIKNRGLPAKQLGGHNAPYTISEDALLRWHDGYEKEPSS